MNGSDQRTKPPREGLFAKLSGVGAVLGVLVMIFFGVRPDADAPVPTPPSRDNLAVPSGSVTAPSATSVPDSECVGADGSSADCGRSDALLVTSASPCDGAGVTQALGMDPGVLELLVEVRQIGPTCAAAPGAQARAGGATAHDLIAVREGAKRAELMACWTSDRDPGSVVPCSEPHRFEPVTAWRPMHDPETIASECRSAAGSFVAGPVDVHGQPLSSDSVTARSGDQPVFRCLVGSSETLTDSVYQLSGRALPTRAP